MNFKMKVHITNDNYTQAHDKHAYVLILYTSCSVKWQELDALKHGIINETQNPVDFIH